MGWLWTAEDIPGLKTRPKWKPGAVNKMLVRKYMAVREGIDIIAKKKKALLQRKKKIEMKPTLVVKKIDGEYTVQMEVFKKYSKERLLYQYPYEDKPPITYSIGKTEEEKRKIQNQRDRKERRETRRKSRLLQSSFRDKCQEICLKAYNQAIGLHPLPNPNDPECPCETANVNNVSPPIDSCSCSDEGSISSSDTDGDEWTIEFTPPAARWDAKAKHPPVLIDNESQYTYLDYKVKVLDKHGNQVPRYFKGPDGAQECSDLGGFWDPNHVWMEINKDGYIGPDNRWVPMNFIGPDGMFYSAEEGFFTDNTGKTLKIGIDGYIDKDGKWVWYPNKRGPRSTKSKSSFTSTVVARKLDKLDHQVKGKPECKSVTNQISSKGKPGNMKPPTKGQGDKIQKNVSYSGKAKTPVVMSVSVNYDRRKRLLSSQVDPLKYCGVDAKKLAKYREILQGLEIYDDLGDLRPPIKTNRACNTSRKKISPYKKSENRDMDTLFTMKSHNNDTVESTECLSPLIL